MSFVFNGHTPETIGFNNYPVIRLKYGDNAVWSGPLEFVAKDASSSIKLQLDSGQTAPTLYYRVNNGAKTQYDFSTCPTINLTTNDEIIWYGVNNTSRCYYNFVTTGSNMVVKGSLTSLINGFSILSSVQDYAYEGLFAGCSIKDASRLELGPMGVGAFKSLFLNCTSLTSIPSLSATVLSANCYEAMFKGCTALTVSPSLPAVNIANSSYKEMFSGCTLLSSDALVVGLESVGENGLAYMYQNCSALNTIRSEYNTITSLGTRAMSNMFESCTSLTSVANIFPSVCGVECYSGLFYGCTSLVSCSDTVSVGAYGQCKQMFYGCTNLTTTPTFNINFTSSASAGSVFYQTFYNCSSLVTMPNIIHSSVSGQDAYYSTFEGCTNLKNLVPLIIYMNNNSTYTMCYSMFKNCTSLERVENLQIMNGSASQMNQELNYMFDGCTNLSFINIDSTYLPQHYGWLQNVSATGTMRCYSSVFDQSTSRGPHTVPSGWTIENEDYLTLTRVSGTASIRFILYTVGSPTQTATFQYSRDKTNWYNIDRNGAFDINNSGVVYLRGYSTGTAESYSAYRYIGAYQANKLVNVSGDITSLLNGFGHVKNIDQNSAFCSLFNARGIPYVADASGLKLPSTTLSPYCYLALFYNQTTMTAAPAELPAVRLSEGCYYEMFRGCTSLTSAPDIKMRYPYYAACQKMFYNCRAMVTPPTMYGLIWESEKPSGETWHREYGYTFDEAFRYCSSMTTLPNIFGERVGWMTYSYTFANCTSLIDVSSWPTLLSATQADELDDDRYAAYYGMFEGCTSLTTAPDTCSTVVSESQYANTFKNCTALVVAPILPATVLKTSCYSSMFNGCSNLNTITVAFEAWGTNNETLNWLNNVAASGTFNCPNTLGTESTITRSVSNCPSGWTVVNTNTN